MPRLRRSDKRKHELSLEVLSVLAHVEANQDPEPWVALWGGAAEAEVAFEALRGQLRVDPQQSYEKWLTSLTRAADDDEPDEDAAPWAGRVRLRRK